MPPPPPASDDFQTKLAEWMARVEEQGTKALDGFLAENPAFATRLGRHADWLLDRCFVHRQDDLPEEIGPYRVRGRIEAGGMGEVYLADQIVPFRRVVAVKVIRSGLVNESRKARFATEIQALALLNHNGIAKVFDAGFADGRPYFAMEYVPGSAITDYCSEHRLSLAARLRLFVDVCHAVEYAHSQGIIHRDLKPSNILVAGAREEPIAKIIDFGLAKAILPERAGPMPALLTDQAVGTPEYMSPEQADYTGTLAVDARADVYALGVVLYELVTGTRPLRLRESDLANVDALMAAIRRQVPPTPSTRVSEGGPSGDAFADRCGLRTAQRLRRRLAGDLDAIAMKALAKQADARYGSAQQLADDIVCCLQQRPVAARTHTRLYLVARLCQRNATRIRVAAIVAATVCLSLLVVDRVLADKRELRNRTELAELAGQLDQLYQDERDQPAPARPEGVAALRDWLRDVRFIAAQRPRLAAFLAQPVDPDPLVQPVCEKVAWAQSHLERMLAPGEMVDQVQLRLDWAVAVTARTVDQPTREWQQVQREVAADGRFAGVRLSPQPGLVPLGRSPQGWQEFGLLLPGTRLPERLADGRLEVDADTCPVFVLLCGGNILTGSQDTDEQAANYDPEREPFESAPAIAHIDPFFASKYEFTNGQWCHVNPPDSNPESAAQLLAPSQPAVHVAWDQIMHTTTAWGMRLPTPDEWEYLARGDTRRPRWCGPTAASLEGNENLNDTSLSTAKDMRGEGAGVPWSDGFKVTAPVGSLRPNPFGLYDVLGNACEAVATIIDSEMTLEFRGSSWHTGSRAARATARVSWDGRALNSLGFRPVISIRD